MRRLAGVLLDLAALALGIALGAALGAAALRLAADALMWALIG